MKTKKLSMIKEISSPLFRIVGIYNETENNKRESDNNISAFHIGNGYILSVAHSLCLEAGYFKSISETLFQDEVIPHLSPAEVRLFEKWYTFDPKLNKRYLNEDV